MNQCKCKVCRPDLVKVKMDKKRGSKPTNLEDIGVTVLKTMPNGSLMLQCLKCEARWIARKMEGSLAFPKNAWICVCKAG